MLIEKGQFGPQAVLEREPSLVEMGELRERGVRKVVINEGLGWRGRRIDFLAELPWLHDVEILAHMSRIEDDSPVFRLHDLVRLQLETYAANSADFTAVPRLESLTYIWRRRTKGLDRLSALRELVLMKYGRADLSELTGARALQVLMLLGGTLTELNAVRAFSDLRKLRLASFRKLAILNGVEVLGRLEWLLVQSCKSLTSLEPLAACASLRELHLVDCDSIESLEPLCRLKQLQAITLSGSTTVRDGRVGFLHELGVRRVRFAPRKHYDATDAEFRPA